MKVLIDTNVVLDSLLGRKPFMEEADKIFELASQSAFEVFLTANMLTDIYYIIRKSLPVSNTSGYLAYLLDFFKIISISGLECKLALDSQNPDFEDALVEVCASRSGMDYIITRDQEFLNSCQLAISPQDFLKQIQNL